MKRTILVIHPGALGDVLLAVPAIRELRAQHPQHQLALCAKGSVAQVLLECKEIDARISIEGSAWGEVFDPDAPLKGELKDWLSCCDRAIAWMQDERGTLASVLRKAGARSTIVSSPFAMGLKATHQSDRFCEIAKVSPASVVSSEPLRLPGEMRSLGRACLENAAIGLDRPLVAVHPGSGSPQKSVAVRTMARMIAKIQGEGVIPIVIEGPADREAVRDLLGEIPSPITVIRPLDLRTLAGVLSHTRLFVGHDSGVTHLVALLGVPTVAIFGPTDPERWAPLGSHVTIMKWSPSSVHEMISFFDRPLALGTTNCPNS
ncbi:glycosyltransferase family 9 protein [Petrachloros mirabilis]